MELDQISAVEIGQDGRLHVSATDQEFPLAYLEAMEVSWEPDKRALVSPPPREWTYVRWFKQILAVASAQGVQLLVGPHTQWINVPANVRADILEAVAHAA